jgi:hypothetical protein
MVDFPQQSRLLRSRDGRDNFVHRFSIRIRSWQMVPHHDGENDRPAACAIEISAQRARLAEGTGLGEDMVLQWRLGEAAFQAAIDTAYGQAGFPVCEPGLGRRELEELGGGAWGNKIMPAQAGAVEEYEVIWVEARLDQKRTHHASAGNSRTIPAEDSLPKVSQKQLGVEVLTDFIRKDHIFGERD